MNWMTTTGQFAAGNQRSALQRGLEAGEVAHRGSTATARIEYIACTGEAAARRLGYTGVPDSACPECTLRATAHAGPPTLTVSWTRLAAGRAVAAAAVAIAGRWRWNGPVRRRMPRPRRRACQREVESTLRQGSRAAPRPRGRLAAEGPLAPAVLGDGASAGAHALHPPGPRPASTTSRRTDQLDHGLRGRRTGARLERPAVAAAGRPASKGRPRCSSRRGPSACGSCASSPWSCRTGVARRAGTIAAERVLSGLQESRRRSAPTTCFATSLVPVTLVPHFARSGAQADLDHVVLRGRRRRAPARNPGRSRPRRPARERLARGTSPCPCSCWRDAAAPRAPVAEWRRRAPRRYVIGAVAYRAPAAGDAVAGLVSRAAAVARRWSDGPSPGRRSAHGLARPPAALAARSPAAWLFWRSASWGASRPSWSGAHRGPRCRRRVPDAARRPGVPSWRAGRGGHRRHRARRRRFEVLLRAVVEQATVDVLHLSLHPFDPPRLALLFGLVLLHAGVVGGAVLVLVACASRGGCDFRPARSRRAARRGMLVPSRRWSAVAECCPMGRAAGARSSPSACRVAPAALLWRGAEAPWFRRASRARRLARRLLALVLSRRCCSTRRSPT